MAAEDRKPVRSEAPEPSRSALGAQAVSSGVGHDSEFMIGGLFAWIQHNRKERKPVINGTV